MFTEFHTWNTLDWVFLIVLAALVICIAVQMNYMEVQR